MESNIDENKANPTNSAKIEETESSENKKTKIPNISKDTEDFINLENDEISEEIKKELIEKINNQIEKYRKFLTFDWANNEKWKLYFYNLLPIPKEKEKIMYFRKKFYNLNIDEEFDYKFNHHAFYKGENLNNERLKNSDINEINEKYNNERNLYNDNTGKATNTSNSTNSSKNNNTNKNKNFYSYKATPGKENIFIQTLHSCSAILFLLFFFFFFSKTLVTLPITIACLTTCLTQVGIRIWKKEVREKMKLNSYFQMLLYSTFVLATDELNHVLLVPLLIQTILFIAYYCRYQLRIFRFINRLFNKINENEGKIELSKAYSLVIIGGMLFFGILININQGFIILSHWLFLLFLYNNNYEVKIVFGKINIAINKVQKGKHTPVILSKLLSKIVDFCIYLAGSSKDKDS